MTRPSLAGIERDRARTARTGRCVDATILASHVPALLAAVREALAEVERFRFTGLGIPSGFDEGTDTAAYAIFCALATHLDLTDPEGDPR